MADTAAGTSVNKNISAEDTAGQSAPRIIGPATGPDAARVLLVLALVLSALSYVNTLRFQFVYDDLPQIVNNPRVHTWSHAERVFSEHVWSQLGGQPGNYYRPLFILWLMVNYSLFGLHPMGWHAITVLSHLAMVVMVYLLLRRVLGDRLTAAMGTIIWAVHPTHIETVAWISGVPDSLLGVFLIGSVLTFARAQEEEGRRAVWTAASVVLYALAMMSKETGVMLPLILFGYEWLLIRRRGNERGSPAQIIRRYLPYAVAGVAYLIVRRLVLHQLSYPDEKPWINVVLTLPSLMWFYIRELFWPANLSVFHDTPLVAHPGLTSFVLPLIGVAAGAGALVYASSKAREVAFGAWWLVVLMVPPIMGIYTFIPEDLVHDRYLYLPTVGLAIVCAWAIRKIRSPGWELFGAPGVQMSITLALGVIMAASTVAQDVYWTNDVILYAHAVQTAPNNVLAINHLANEFYKRKEVAKTMALYNRSLQVKPHWATHFAMGVTLYELHDLPEAQKHLEMAIPLLPGNADEYYYLGLTLMGQEHYAEAEPYFRKAISLYAKPGYHWALAMSLVKQDKLAAARDEFRAEWIANPRPEVKQELEKVEKQLATGS